MQFLSSLVSLSAGQPAPWLARVGERHHVRLARADEPALQALVRARYGWRGLRVQGPGRASLTLAACEGRRVVATLGVALDGPAGLAADDTFAPEVARLRRSHRLCEFTRLASEGGPRATPLLAVLLHTAWVAAHRLHAADVVLMEVHPRHARFYERQLGCRRMAGERPNRHVQAPAVLLAAEAGPVRQRLRALAGSDARHSLCAHGLSTQEEDRVLCRLLMQLSVGAAGGVDGGGRQGGWPRPAAVPGSQSLEETLVSLAVPR